jgi:putative endonuclease
VPAEPQPTAHAAGRAGRDGDPRRALGTLGEQHAAAHLQRLGFQVLARNVRTRHGEIDLIAFASGVLVFVEVKTRRSGTRKPDSTVHPLEGLQPPQRLRLRRLALAWLSDRGRERPRAHTIRFDAIGVVLGARDQLVRLDHLEGAW